MMNFPALNAKLPILGALPVQKASDIMRPTVNTPTMAPGPLSQFEYSGRTLQTAQGQALIQQALARLAQIRNLPADEAYMRQLGISLVFHSGQEALQSIQGKGIRVEFGDMGDSPAHAQWLADQRVIMVNQRYKNDASPANLNAIAEAIYHEAGHAVQRMTDPATGAVRNLSLESPDPNAIGDDRSSIQEELNCLALNTLAHRYHEASDPAYAQMGSSSRLVSDGVKLYTKLFFDPDPYKRALINRVTEKYGDLPLSSPGHETSVSTNTPQPLALRVARQAALKNLQPLAGIPPAFGRELSTPSQSAHFSRLA